MNMISQTSHRLVLRVMISASMEALYLPTDGQAPTVSPEALARAVEDGIEGSTQLEDSSLERLLNDLDPTLAMRLRFVIMRVRTGSLEQIAATGRRHAKRREAAALCPLTV
jgi:hypothetical protein